MIAFLDLFYAGLAITNFCCLKFCLICWYRPLVQMNQAVLAWKNNRNLKIIWVFFSVSCWSLIMGFGKICFLRNDHHDWVGQTKLLQVHFQNLYLDHLFSGEVSNPGGTIMTGQLVTKLFTFRIQKSRLISDQLAIDIATTGFGCCVAGFL